MRLEGMAKLVPESLSPDFILSDNNGDQFDFHAYKGKARHKLLLFWSAGCEHCIQLAIEIFQWQNKPGNKDKLDIVAVSMDETETEIHKWNEIIINFPGWKHLCAKEGVNSAVANDYAILATPVMFLIRSKSNIIEAVPGNLEQLIKALDGK